MIVGRVVWGKFSFSRYVYMSVYSTGGEIECYLSIQVSMLIFILI